ncbi:MAG: metallopeptidase TldD-related protein [Thermoanaerobaculia bacterium]
MWFSEADSSALGRCLAQVADADADAIDLFLERKLESELRSEEPGPGVVERRDQGFAVRLVREGQTYLAARDGFGTRALESALRDVARVSPAAPYRVPQLAPPEAFGGPIDAGSEPDYQELAGFAALIRQRVRERHSAFEFRLRLARLRRELQIVGRRLVPGAETETLFSFDVSTPWGRFGSLSADLGADAAAGIADCLIGRFQARAHKPMRHFAGPLVLGPAATAVLLHEAVAHALETDTLVLSGRPEAAIGVSLGSELLDVLDSPGDLPEGLRRTTDDEGLPVLKRWLLQRGEVSQPLADRFHAGLSSHLLPGAARRESRHVPPGPRSTHLELLAGESSDQDLLAGKKGVYLPEISRGRLDPLSGELTVEFPYGRRFRSGELADWVGRSTLRGKVREILAAVEAVGSRSVFAGAGWCAKAGQRLPVWATCSGLRLAGLEAGP